MSAQHDEAPAGAAARGPRELENTLGSAASFCSTSAVLYTRMCEAIAHCEQTLEAELEELPIEDQLRACAQIAGNYEPESVVCEIRVRAERCFNVLLRDAAGLPPKNKRDAKWLAGFRE